MATYTWEPSSDSPLPTDYLLERSTDNGLSWSSIVTIPHVVPGVDYDTETGLFTYTDGAPVAGEIVRIQSVDSGDSTRDSSYRFRHGAPAEPQKVHLFGVVVDSLTGESCPNVEVRICPIPESSSTFVPSEGTSAPPSVRGQGLLGFKRVERVFTDDSGNWSVDVLGDFPLEVQIPTVGFTLAFRTPRDRDTLNVVDAYVYRLGGGSEAQTPYEYGAGSGYVT